MYSFDVNVNNTNIIDYHYFKYLESIEFDDLESIWLDYAYFSSKWSFYSMHSFFLSNIYNTNNSLHLNPERHRVIIL